MIKDDVSELKRSLRLKYKSLRISVNSRKKINMDEKIHSRLLSLKEYINCPCIFTYVSKDGEVDTISIILSSLEKKKKVAVPKCLGEENQMDFYFIKSVDDLSLGKLGILEPDIQKCEKAIKFQKKSLCIVPGLSFDLHGFRLGYGKGYYDRFLEFYEGCTIGLCYSNSIMRRLPTEKFDKPVKFIITNEFIKRTS